MNKGVQPRLEAFFGKPTIIKHGVDKKMNEKQKAKSLKKK